MTAETLLFGTKRSSENKNTRKRRWIKHTVFKRDGGKCFWCDRRLTMETRSWPIPFNLATVDHIRPTSKGGKTLIENVVLSCFPCNNDRGNVPADEYLALVEGRKNTKEYA